MFNKLVNLLSVIAVVLSAITVLSQTQSNPWPVQARSISAANSITEVSQTNGGNNVFNYQGILRNANGALVNGSYAITFKLYKDVTGGSPEFEEIQTSVLVRDGIFNVLLGNQQGKLISNDIVRISPLYLGIAVAPDGEMQPRQRIHAVPRALLADTANSIKNGDLFVRSQDGSASLEFIVNSVTAPDGNGGNSHIQAINGPLYINPFKANGTDHKVIIGGGEAVPTFEVWGHTFSRDTTISGDLSVSGVARLNGTVVVGGPIQWKPHVYREDNCCAGGIGPKRKRIETNGVVLTENNAVCFLAGVKNMRFLDDRAEVQVFDGEWYVNIESNSGISPPLADAECILFF